MWMPPGGGSVGALNHVVIHSLDITVPLGLRHHIPDETVRLVLDDLVGGTHAHFGFDLESWSLQATDMAWIYGAGTPIRGTAEELVLLICGRHVPGLG